ncbi:pilus assembly protein TadG-related protein [Salinibacterium sp. ZJ454]|uniref:pilus assembly protein TadG-related protein n=1 Tax=Salinibacterium sp. ZJ454 TaxID=2708339 RepID=UPI00141D8695|nr:pilus assembly protein TadG-related protein [Salinibacterium sp. ZJ454]
MTGHRRVGAPARDLADNSYLADDTGSTLPLIFFYAALSLILILLVTAATALYLERKRLFTLADGAALAAAEAFPLSAVNLTDRTPRLQSPDVAAAVAAYLAAAPADFEALAIEHAGTDDGRSARVTLSAYWRPPVLTVLVPDGLRIEVTSTARSVFF